MIRLYHGDDSFESYLACKTDAKKYADENGFDLVVKNLDELNPESFFNLTLTTGMFSSGSVVLGKRLFSNTTLLEEVTKNFEMLNNQIDIFLWEDGKADGKRKLLKTISKENIKTFTLPKLWEIDIWIKKYSDKFGLNLTKPQLAIFIERFGTDKWIIAQELKKLWLLKKQSSNFESVWMQSLSTGSTGVVWDVTDACLEKKGIVALKKYSEISKIQDFSQLIISLLHSQFINLGIITSLLQENKPTSSSGIHPYVIKKFIKFSKNFSLKEIATLLVEIDKIDSGIKKGVDANSVFLEFFTNPLLNKL